MTNEVIARYRQAIRTGSPDDVASFAATGVAGLLVLRDDLAGHLKLDIGTGVHPRDQVDNLTAAVAAIARAEPEAFVDVFADPEFDRDTYVLTGLGEIDDPRATERLARAAASPSAWIRMDAAIGLGRRADPLATSTLSRLLGDREYLVRYHALKSLASIGAGDALEALRRFEPHAPIERTLADEAIAAIESRVSGAEPTG